MNEPTIQRTHYHVSEVATMYGVSVSTTLRWITRGWLKAIDVGTETQALWRIPAAALESFDLEKANRSGGRKKRRKKSRRNLRNRMGKI